jgi:SAM-dependent methyltransferase
MNKMRRDWDARAKKNAMHYIAERNDPEVFWESGREAADMILERAYDLCGHDTVMEVGCGIGRVLAHMAGKFKKAIGADVSPEMVSQAVTLNPALTFHIVSGTDVQPVPDNSVNLAYTVFVIEHIPKRTMTRSLFTDVRRALVPGGILLTANLIFDKPKRGRIFSTWRGDQWDKESYLKMLKEIGFEIVATEERKMPDGNNNLWTTSRKI